MSLDELYQDIILDHYRRPRNKEAMIDPDLSLARNNPLCGDEIEVYVRLLDDGQVAKISFLGQGCAISQASASMMTESLQGKSLQQVNDTIRLFRSMMQGEISPDEDEIGELAVLNGVVKYPVRVKCAVLAWTTVQEAINKYQVDTRSVD